MKVKLTKPFMVRLDAGEVVNVNEGYAATLKALKVAEALPDKPPAQKRTAKKAKPE